MRALWLLLAACAQPVHGRLVDAFSGDPIAGVWVASDGAEVQTGPDGAFSLAAPPRGRLALGGACGLQSLAYADPDVGAVRVLRWRGTRQAVPDGIVAIDGVPAASRVLRDCMPARAVRVTLADGSTAIVRPTVFE